MTVVSNGIIGKRPRIKDDPNAFEPKDRVLPIFDDRDRGFVLS
jgi:hypothetical protein